MPVSYQAGHNISSGTRLSQPGWYHLIVDEVQCPPLARDNTLIPNGFMKICCTCAAGSVPGCEDKAAEIMLFHPKPDNPDFAQRVNDRALVALSAMRPDQVGQQIEFEPADLANRQLIAHLELDRNNKYLQLAYGDIFHIDDPEVATQPKNESALKLIPMQLRWAGGKAAGKGVATPKTATPAQQAAADPLDASDVDCI